MTIVRKALIFIIFLVPAGQALSQACFSTGVNGTVINLPCNVTCTPMNFKVPHLKSTSDYSIVNTAYAPLAFTSPTATEVTSIYSDDKFSIAYPLPYPFCFYDSMFTQFVIGSNGVITFDLSQANCNNAWKLETGSVPQPIPFLGAQSCINSSGPKYSSYSIYSPYHDINPNVTSTSPNRKIEWRVEGTAPCRKLVVTFFQIPLFGHNAQLNTSQVIMYESTGMIDIFVANKALDSDGSVWNGNLAILGLQKDATKANPVPGKNATVWSESNTAYRFVPSGPVSRFVKAELCDLAGTVLATTGTTTGADTATTTPGLLDLNFPPQCPVAATTQYIVKTYFASCSNPSQQMVSSDTITVNKTTSLMATTATTPSACGPNGSITVNIPAGAGTAPYTLSINGGAPVQTSASTYTFTGLVSGNHSITLTTAGGCSQVINASVASSGILTVQAVPAAPSCAGASNGSITINPQNGQPPFLYNINNNPVYQASNTFTGLMPGTYLIGVKDASGCILTNYSVVVPQGAPLTATLATTPPACPGAANGSITVTPTNGLAPYQYSLNGNPVFQSSNVFTNLASGSYFVSIRDAQNCSVNLSVVVGPGSGTLNATATASGTSCTGATNGSITITPASGSGPYQYSVNGGPFVTGTVIPNLAAGTYSVVVKDNAGCASAPIPVTVAQGSALLATASTAATSCPGVSNGQITITPTNGSGPYQYQLNGGSFQPSNTFTGVPAGSHSVVVQDAAGCVSAPISVTVAAGNALLATAATVATSCPGASNGQITVTPSNGSGPYQYQLNGGTYQSSNTFTGVPTGNHTVIVQDASGCISAPISVTVAPGTALTATATTLATSCPGAGNGQVTVTPTNGSGPYQYQLNGGTFQSSNIFTGVTAGNHSVVVQDAAGCISAPITVTINAGPALAGSVSATGTSCTGAVDGSITITTSNGTAPFTYSVDGGAFQASSTIGGLAAGSHTVVIQDAAGCTSVPIPVTVNAGAPLAATVNAVPATCNGTSTGTATVSANNPGTFEYSLDGIQWQSSATFTGLAAGSYTAYIRNASGCNGSQAFTIAQPNALEVTAAVSPVLCNGQSNGTISASAVGGTAPYSFSIDGTNYQTGATFNVPAGAYTVYVKDVNNCTHTETVNITEPAVLSAAAATQDATCAGGADGQISVAASGGTGSYTYSLNGSAFQISSTFNATGGTYYVVVKDANNCTATVTATVGLNNNLTLTPAPDALICEGASAVISSQTNATQFSWSPASGLNNPASASPVASPASTTTYYLAASLGGCTIYDTVVVNVNPAPVPNAGAGGTICFGQTFQLQGTNGVTYSWTGAGLSDNTISNPVASPSQTTTYLLHVTDANGCSSLQPAAVTVNVTPPLTVIATPDTVAAMGDQFQLHASSAGTSYSWTPATGLSNPGIADPVVTITGDITYTVTASTPQNCIGTATVVIKVYEGPELYTPKAFTPNGDGLNDIFRPFPVGIKKLNYFRVYNRWGQVIYSTSSLYDGWDGKIAGVEQQTGTFAWVAEGVTKDDRRITRKGVVTLIR
ncbi:MAG TPA: gliding motility-associated C-terminal domain-containing protein [Flavisolibacter sp.]